MLEKILEEFNEAFYGYLRVNVTIHKFSLDNRELEVEEKIKFYFWINVYGICSMKDPGRAKVWKEYSENYLSTNQDNNSTKNGFKIMNDESEMMKLILPTIKN